MDVRSKLQKRVSALVAIGLATSLMMAATSPANGVCSDCVSPDSSLTGQDVIYEVNIRQYTEAGTFDAFAAELPRLKELGVSVLWLMPIHPISVLKRKGTLGSYYSVANYKAVNPEFGTAQDFADLVQQAHDLGFKVILDWVANHTGWDNPWITAHKDWYTQDSQGNIIPPVADWSDVADLNYDNADMRAAMIDAMKYWVTTYDIDGFRADVAGSVPTSFWNQASAALRQIKPQFMLAEDQDNKALLNSAFDANYSWSLLAAMRTYAGNWDKEQFKAIVQMVKSAYPAGKFPMVFITNHDENSWNGTEFERMSSNVRAMAGVYFTLPGVPLLYTGQEIGLNRRLQFFEKDTVTWQPSSYTKLYQKLIALKHRNVALWNGSLGGPIRFLASSNLNVMSYVRAKGNNRVIVVVNPSNKKVTTKVTLGKFAGKFKSFSNQKTVKLGKTFKVKIPAHQFVIFSTN